MTQKILLVGDPRLCSQVAYVMDWPDFEQVEQLTALDKYRDYKIVVCAFKKKAKKLVKVKDQTFDLMYLEDICRALDSNEVYPPILKPTVPLWRRVIDRIIAGEVLIAFLRRHRRKNGSLKSKFWIERMPIAELKLSELFIKVLYSKPCKVQCNVLENLCYVYGDGKIRGCCCCDMVFGDITQDKLDVVYNSPLARIVRLSSLNKSLCFCDLKECNIAREIPETGGGGNQSGSK